MRLMLRPVAPPKACALVDCWVDGFTDRNPMPRRASFLCNRHGSGELQQARQR
jgi:hypothetical protein